MKQGLMIIAALLMLSLLGGAACIEFDASMLNEVEYKLKMGNNAVEISQAVEDMDLANTTADVDFEDEAWRNETKDKCQQIRDLCDEAATIEPPESMEVNHEVYEEASARFQAAADLIESGVDQADEELIAQGQAEIDAGAELLQEFYGDMDEPWIADLEENFNIESTS
jgi:hypothetical protein